MSYYGKHWAIKIALVPISSAKHPSRKFLRSSMHLSDQPSGSAKCKRFQSNTTVQFTNGHLSLHQTRLDMWRERCPLLVPSFWKFHGKNLHPESARSLKCITRLQQLSLWDSILLYVLVLLPRSMAEKQGCWRQWLLAERIAILAFWPFPNLEPRSLFLTILYWREYIPIQVLVDRSAFELNMHVCSRATNVCFVGALLIMSPAGKYFRFNPIFNLPSYYMFEVYP